MLVHFCNFFKDIAASGAAEHQWAYAENQTAALTGADALVIVTEWKEFKSPDFPTIKAALKQPVIFDGRNLHEPKLVRGMGFEYLAQPCCGLRWKFLGVTRFRGIVRPGCK